MPRREGESNINRTIDITRTIAYNAGMKTPPDPVSSTRKSLTLPNALWDAINEYRHSERIPSEVEAIRRILSEWLAAQPEEGEAGVSGEDKAPDHQHRTMAAAFQALLNGDTSKRDSLIEDMERARLMDAKERALQKLKEIDFFVRPDGVSIKSRDILRVAL